MIDVYVNLRFFPNPKQLPASVARWDELGLRGVTLGDHVFSPSVPYDSPEAHKGMEEMTILTVIAALSERLRVGSVAANVGFQHPLLLIRKFAQLAVLYGGDRVYAGLGAGWARREFRAIGLQMRPHADRLDRLEESLQLARALFTDGYATLDGKHVKAFELPLAPLPPDPPRLLVGGGSARLLAMAGRYADHIDLNAPSHRASKFEPQRKLMTTIEDLERSMDIVRRASASGGRARETVTSSVTVTEISFCNSSEIRAETERICQATGMAPISLADCPFALVGEPERMAAAIGEWQERIGIEWIGIPYWDVERFYREVVPLLA